MNWGLDGASLVAQTVKNLPAMQETRVWSLGWEERKWQPTPVFLPGEFHGQRSLVGFRSWSCKELGTTEWLTHTQGVDVTSRWQMKMPWLWGLFKPISGVCDSWLPGILVRAIFCHSCLLGGRCSFGISVSVSPNVAFSAASCTERRSNQTILKEISPECSLEGLMLRLKL